MIRAWWAGLVLVVGCGGGVAVQDGGGGAGAGGDGGGGDGGGLPLGSCSAEVACGDLGVCIYSPGSCDAGAIGSCQGGYTCDGPASGPVCTCDGEVVEGEYGVCEMWGNSLPYHDDPTPCAVGTFACGTETCQRHVEVCVVTQPGAPGAETTYACEKVADHAGWCSHGIGDCSCLDLESLGCPEFDTSCCTSDEDHQETVTIALP